MESVLLEQNVKTGVTNGFRTHIGIFGRRNVGKSSLLNSITKQKVSIVSETPGTTTDSVKKAMELPSLGPVIFIDTAGLDDEGMLGTARVNRARRVLDRADIALVVSDSSEFGFFENVLLAELKKREIPSILVFNKIDHNAPSLNDIRKIEKSGIKVVLTNALSGQGTNELKEALVEIAATHLNDRGYIVADLLPQNAAVVLVVPIDQAAPRGRLILPQVQTIRELLDAHVYCVVTQAEELPIVIANFKKKPDLVITDSQAFRKVVAMTPHDVKVTSFSILFSRIKGDLEQQVQGVLAMDQLRPGDSVLIAEACSHHPTSNDIGRVQIPKLVETHVGGSIHFDTVQGRDDLVNLDDYKLVIHCGACMWNRREMQTRLVQCRKADVPITNYGIAIAYTLGILTRALQIFPGMSSVVRT